MLLYSYLHPVFNLWIFVCKCACICFILLCFGTYLPCQWNHLKAVLKIRCMTRRKKSWGWSSISVTCFFFPSFQLPATAAHQSAQATMVCDRAGQDRRGRQTLVDTHFLFPPVILLTQGSATLSASLVLLGTSSRCINTQEKLPALLQNMIQK